MENTENIKDIQVSRKQKHNGITFFDIALDCLGLHLLTFFWLFIFWFPLLLLIYCFVKGINLFIIIYIIIFMMLSLVPYYISRGIVKRKRIYIVIGLLLSIMFVHFFYKQTMGAKVIGKENLFKLISNIESLILWSLTSFILFISLFLKRIYKKQ